MSVWHGYSATPVLGGSDGELISLQVSVKPRELEDLLECLASLSFPVNPEIHHGVPTTVSFPAWATRLREVSEALKASGFDPRALQVRTMLEEIAV